MNFVYYFGTIVPYSIIVWSTFMLMLRTCSRARVQALVLGVGVVACPSPEVWQSPSLSSWMEGPSAQEIVTWWWILTVCWGCEAISYLSHIVPGPDLGNLPSNRVQDSPVWTTMVTRNVIKLLETFWVGHIYMAGLSIHSFPFLGTGKHDTSSSTRPLVSREFPWRTANMKIGQNSRARIILNIPRNIKTLTNWGWWHGFLFKILQGTFVWNYERNVIRSWLDQCVAGKDNDQWWGHCSCLYHR